MQFYAFSNEALTLIVDIGILYTIYNFVDLRVVPVKSGWQLVIIIWTIQFIYLDCDELSILIHYRVACRTNGFLYQSHEV